MAILTTSISDFRATKAVTRRELFMLEFMGQITDKPNWQVKIHDEGTVEKWRIEACGTAEQQETSHRHLSNKCFDFCIGELRDKATYEQKYGLIHVLDVEQTIVKADLLGETDSFCDALRGAVRPLENVRDGLKDWHPGSKGLVLDLVHPSLFPLHYGYSRVLPYGTVALRNCSGDIGYGEQIAVPSTLAHDRNFTLKQGWGNETTLKPWGDFQWLPSEISFHDGAASIDSYINNLHPHHYGDLYKVLATAVDRAVPLWDECLSWFHDRTRIAVRRVSFGDFLEPPIPLEAGVVEENDDDADDADDREYEREQRCRDWLEDHPDERRLRQPDPRSTFMSFEKQVEQKGLKRLDLRADFPGGLQVIFKLANIHLTPGKPDYSGSNWHVEGALNEHICATALFYYEQDNIEDSYLEFRQKVDSEAMVSMPEQYEYAAVEDMYGISNEEAAVQELGKVLTRERRILAFPNVMQHRVRPFKLADPTKPGHRKLLALFLVDPHIPILSTAHVPPQRRDWWADEIRRSVDRFAALPTELFDRIIEAVDDFPINWEKACEMREELMAERGRITDDYNETLQEDTFYFCEH